MSFIQFRDAVNKQIQEMTKDNTLVFEVSVDRDKVWEIEE